MSTADMIKHTLSFFSRHQLEHKRIVVAYSGGIDSQVMLHLLVQLTKTKQFPNLITVCHVHHGLNEKADNWALFAKEQCQQMGVGCDVKMVEVSAKGGIEAAARQARYQAIAEIAQPDDIIVTGHHLDDQAETILLALKRGAGIQGLSAMTEVAPFPIANRDKKLTLVRPLLAITRGQIENYAAENKLVWVEDDSNLNERYDRNFIRNQILPTLKKRWPAISTTFARSAENCRESMEILTQVAESDFQQCFHSPESLLIDKLRILSSARFNNLIRYFLSLHEVELPSRAMIHQIQAMLTVTEDGQPQVQLDKSFIRRHKNILVLTPAFADISLWQSQVKIATKEVCEVELPDGLSSLRLQVVNSGDLRLSLPENGVLSIQFNHNNPLVWPHFRSKRRVLKKVLQEADIPWWQRKRLPIIYYGEKLVAIPSLFIDREFLAKNDEPGLIIDSLLEQNH